MSFSKKNKSCGHNTDRKFGILQHHTCTVLTSQKYSSVSCTSPYPTCSSIVFPLFTFASWPLTVEVEWVCAPQCAPEDVLVSKSSKLHFQEIKLHFQKFQIDLQNEPGDILLRITFRTGKEKIYFQDRAGKSLGDGWGEVQGVRMGFRADGPVTITVHNCSTASESNRYQILFHRGSLRLTFFEPYSGIRRFGRVTCYERVSIGYLHSILTNDVLFLLARRFSDGLPCLIFTMDEDTCCQKKRFSSSNQPNFPSKCPCMKQWQDPSPFTVDLFRLQKPNVSALLSPNFPNSGGCVPHETQTQVAAAGWINNAPKNYPFVLPSHFPCPWSRSSTETQDSRTLWNEQRERWKRDLPAEGMGGSKYRSHQRNRCWINGPIRWDDVVRMINRRIGCRDSYLRI